MRTFQLVRSRRILASPVFSLDRQTWRAPGGQTFERHSIQHPGAVAMLPRDARGRFLLVRQFRAAIKRELLEIPAGTLEPGEAPLACARRELIEETGFAARRWKKLGAIHNAPGYSSERIVLYLAWDLYPAHGEQDADEDVRAVALTRAALNAAIRSGRLTDAKTLSALLLYGACSRNRT
jgi:ADP-ribose pyrophosphatase